MSRHGERKRGHPRGIVLIKGNSFLDFVEVDLALMVARVADGVKIKPSARRALKVCSALYLPDNLDGDSTTTARERFASWVQNTADEDLIKPLPIYMREDLPQLITRIRAIRPTLAA